MRLDNIGYLNADERRWISVFGDPGSDFELYELVRTRMNSDAIRKLINLNPGKKFPLDIVYSILLKCVYSYNNRILMDITLKSDVVTNMVSSNSHGGAIGIKVSDSSNSLRGRISTMDRAAGIFTFMWGDVGIVDLDVSDIFYAILNADNAYNSISFYRCIESECGTDLPEVFEYDQPIKVKTIFTRLLDEF